ncbi:MAG: LysR family transcriptional regulator, partial [Pseudomonadota bacterium]
LTTVRLLLEVRRCGGFAAAARVRDLDPSSVSRAVAQAEAEIGARLFQRSTRRLTATEAGEAYLARAEAGLEALEAAAEAARGAGDGAGASGVLRMTASTAFAARRLTPVLTELRRAHPELRVELIATDATLDLVGERIDLAVRHGPGLSGDLVAAKLAETRYRVVAAPGWADAAGLDRPEMLSERDCLLLDLPEHRSRWRFRRGAEERVVAVSGALLFNNPLGLRAAALAGLGPALLADWMVDDALEEGRLVALSPDWEAAAGAFGSAVWAAYPSRRFLPRKVRVAIDALRQALSPRAPGGIVGGRGA